MADNFDKEMEQQGAVVWEGGERQTPQEDNTGQSNQPEQDTQDADVKDQPEVKDNPEQKTDQNDGPSGDEKPEEGSDEQKKIDWLSRFNERFQTQYESEDEVKELFNYKDKYSEIEQSLKQKDEALSQASDPSSYFADESIMKINEIVKQHKVDPATASRLVNTDYSQMNSEDILVEQKLMEEPDWRGSEDLLREEIQEQYGLDQNPEDYDEEQQAKIKRKIERGKKRMENDARKAKEKFGQMQQVELPGKQNLEESVKQKKEQLSQSVEQKFDSLTKDLEKVNYHEDMEFQIDDEWKSKNLTKEKITEEATKFGVDLSDEKGYESMKQYLKNRYVLENLPRLFNDYKKKLQTQQKDEEFNKYNNPRENNRQEKPDGAPKPKSREAVNQEIAADMGLKQ